MLPNKASESEKSGKGTPSKISVSGEKKERLNIPAAELKRQLVVEDSIWADFNCSRVKGSIMKAYREGKRIKKEAAKGKGGSKKRDDKIAKNAKNLLWSFVGEQWYLLLLGFPFMFLGSTIEFLVPNFIGKIINEFKEENFDGEGGVKDLIYLWILMTIFSSLCTAVRELLFGITS